MKREFIEENVIRIVHEMPWPGTEAETNSRFVEDLKFDSLDSVELVMELEEFFGMTIPDHDAEACRTVRDVIDLVERLDGRNGYASW